MAWEQLIEEPLFWVAVSFVIFLAGVWKPLTKAILGGLDKRGEEINNELRRAKALREEAEELLADYQKKYNAAVKEAEAMVARTQEDAAALAERAEADLKEALEKRMKLAADKIALAEKKALEDVQNHVVDIAISAAREVIQQQLESGKGEDLVRLAAADVARKVH